MQQIQLSGINTLSKNTEFKNWNEMLRISVIERATRKLMVKTL